MPRVLDNRGYLQVAQEIEGRGIGQATQALTPGRAQTGRTGPAAGDREALARRLPHVGLGSGGGLRGVQAENRGLQQSWGKPGTPSKALK